MAYFVGLDVSVKETAVCVVDEVGTVLTEQKVASEPDDIVTLLTSLGEDYGRIGIEAGPLSQWLVGGMAAADLPVICVETRHMKSLLKAQQINKSDRHDARGIAQMMRVGLFKPVHVKTLASQEKRTLLTARNLVQRKMLDVDADLRGTLRNFGLKVGVVGQAGFEARIRELVEGLSEACRDRRAAAERPARAAPGVHQAAQDAAGRRSSRSRLPAVDDSSRRRRCRRDDLPGDHRSAAALRSFQSGGRACRVDAASSSVRRDRL